MTEALLTFLFTDIEGSTLLWESHPDAMKPVLAQHDAAIEGAVTTHNGRVFKTVGDAAYCAFALPSDALLAAVAIQKTLHEEVWPEGIDGVSVRIGIHTGAAIETADDYFGQPLNRAARLMASAHGGQILISHVTESLVRASLGRGMQLRDLGEHQFKDLSEPVEVYQLLADGLPTVDFPPINSLVVRTNNLPSQTSLFVGREHELIVLRDLIEKHRLVTLAGPGGIGKTRLSLQIAADCIPRFAGGCWFVSLADLNDGSFVIGAIATALEVDSRAYKNIEEALFAKLRKKRLLLVLDNSEQVLPDVARFARTALDRCPELCVLVTSREPTHTAGEQVVRLGPMEPADAVALFRERAQSASGEELTCDADMQDVHAMCERLEGIPLAIELAAGRVAATSTHDLRRRLDSGIDVLSSPDPTQGARHRTLAATISWSYQLLEPAEQVFFASLAVFEGSFDIDACESVLASTAGLPPFEQLTSLVDRSLVTLIREEHSTRYRLLNPIREFVKRELSATALLSLKQRHFDYFAIFTERWNIGDVPTMVRELPNIRAALEFGFKQADRAPALRLLQSASTFWQHRQMPFEAIHWYEIAMRSNIDDTRLLSQVYRRASTFATIGDDYPRARELAQRAFELAGKSNDLAAIAEAQLTLAVIEHRQGNLDTAFARYAQALEGFERSGHSRGVWTALNNQGMILGDQGKPDRAAELFVASALRCKTAGADDELASVLSHHGQLLLNQGRTKEAADFLARALSLKRRLSSAVDLSSILADLGAAAFAGEKFDDAYAYALESLNESKMAQSPSDGSVALELLAAVLKQRGDVKRASDLAGRARCIRDSIDFRIAAPNCIRSALSDVAVHPPERPDEDFTSVVDRVLAAYR